MNSFSHILRKVSYFILETVKLLLIKYTARGLKFGCQLLFLCLFVLFSNHNINSQNIDSVRLQQFLEMPIEEILKMDVVTTSKTSRPATDVTQKVDIITKRHIDQIVSGNRNITELIQYLPGASVKVLSRNDANWGAYGGIGPKYSTFMLQGLPVDAFIDPQSLDAMAIKHIEIQRGPASILYPNFLSQDFAGNQSPLAGTINLILKEEVEKPQTMISLGYGSYNTFSGQAYHENRFGRLHFLSGVSYEKSDYTNYGTSDSWLNILNNPEYQKGKVFIGASLSLDEDEKHKLTFFGNQTIHHGDAGRDNREYSYNYSLINTGYSGQLTENLELAIKAGLRLYDREWQGDKYDTISQTYQLAETSGVEQMIIPLDLSFTFSHFINSNFTIGTDFQQAIYLTSQQQIGQEEVTGNDASVMQIGAYIQEEFRLFNFVIRGGGRYNIINYDIDKIGGETPGSKNKKWDVLLWSAGAKYKFTNDFALFFNAGNSFMSPGLKSIGGTIPLNEMYMPGSNGQLPNPNLEPERGYSLDCGFDYVLPLKIYLSFRAFRTTLKDAIIDNVISQDPSQTMSENADGKTRAQGFEISFKQQIEKKIEWQANLTYTKSEIIDPEQNRIEVPFVPELMGNIGLSLNLPYNIEIYPWVHFGGLIYDNSSREDRNSFNSKELVNLMISKSFLLMDNKELNAFIKIYNLTNNKYEMPWDFQDPGFNITVGSRIVL